MILLITISLLAGCAPATAARPTPLATAQPVPSSPAIRPPLQQGDGNQAATLLHLPGRILSLRLAAHPQAGWAAVAATQRFNLASDPITAYARAQQPTTGIWRPATQLDTGATRLGARTAGAAIAISGDRTLVAAWGGSSADDGGIWVRSSPDSGASWGEPQQVAVSSSAVLDLAASPDGWLVLLASGFRREGPTAVPLTTLVVRQPDGTWRAPQVLELPAMFGAVAISGSGPAARASAWIGTKDEQGVTLVGQQLAQGGPWQLTRHSIALPPEADGEPYFFWFPRGLAFQRQLADGVVQPAIIFSWTRRGHGQIFAITSFDAGQHWGQIEMVRPQIGTELVFSAAPAYDPFGDRLALIFACCADQHEITEAVHYATWSKPGSANWQPVAAPLVLGDRAAQATVVAQAANSPLVWIAWIEESQRVEIRRRSLDSILPP